MRSQHGTLKSLNLLSDQANVPAIEHVALREVNLFKFVHSFIFQSVKHFVHSLLGSKITRAVRREPSLPGDMHAYYYGHKGHLCHVTWHN